MAAANREFRFTGWHMLAILVAFFSVVISVNLTLAVMANRSWTGLVVPNSYVASQQFNGEAQAARQQKALGWQESLTLADGRLTVKLKDAAGQPLAGFHLAVKIGHPVADRFDQRLTLTETEPGIYQAPLRLGQGQWDAEVLAKDGHGRHYRQIHRLTVGG